MQIDRILSGCILSATGLSPWQNMQKNIFDAVRLIFDEFYVQKLEEKNFLLKKKKKEKKPCVC